MSRDQESSAGLQRPPYYVGKRAHPFAFKPYDWRAAKADRHACHNASHRISAALRRLRSQKRADAPLAALEAERLTTQAEPGAYLRAVMSGGAEPAGAAKPSSEAK